MGTSASEPRRTPALRARAALALALLPAPAVAVDVSLQLVPTFGYTRDQTTGAVTASSEAWSLNQKVRLGLGQELASSLRVEAVGTLNWDQGWRYADGAWTDTDRKVWNGDIRLAFGGQPLGGTAYYTRQQSSEETAAAGLILRPPDLLRESFGLGLNWVPDRLPRLSLFYDRGHLTDVPALTRDVLTDSVLLTADYSQVRTLSLRYSLGYTSGDDRISGVVSDSLTQNAQVAWSDTFWERRLVTAASYQAQATSVDARGTGGTGEVQLPQVPQAGLSIVEPPGSLPGQIRLVSTPALVDGNLTAGAGVDIGWGGSVGGDPRPRHVGAQFGDPQTEVELIYLWVDRRLPPDVAAAFQWTAWRSDDGEHWTAVGLAGSVRFGALESRFEIPLVPTRAPFVQVVGGPLPLGVTTDRQYSSILVTEIQLFRVAPVPEGGIHQTAYRGIASASSRLLLLPAWNLAHELAASLTHRSNRAGVDWSLANALSASRRLSALLEGRARLDYFLGRLGLSSGEVSQSDLRLTAGVEASFLPTLRAGATYQGQLAFQGSAVSRSYNSLILSVTAQPYAGFSMSADGSYTRGEDPASSGTFATAGGNASVSVAPNKVVTVTGTAGYGSATSSSPTGTRTIQSGQLAASLVMTPVPSLYGAATVTRYPWGSPPSTVYNLAMTFSPLPGGQLLLTFVYNETLDVANQTGSTFWGPSLRWTIRPSTFLTASYTQLRGSYPTYRTFAEAVLVSLTVTM